MSITVNEKTSPANLRYAVQGNFSEGETLAVIAYTQSPAFPSDTAYVRLAQDITSPALIGKASRDYVSGDVVAYSDGSWLPVSLKRRERANNAKAKIQAELAKELKIMAELQRKLKASELNIAIMNAALDGIDQAGF